MKPNTPCKIKPRWFPDNTPPLSGTYLGLEAGKVVFRQGDERKRLWRFWEADVISRIEPSDKEPKR